MLKFHVKAKKIWSMRQRELAREAISFAMKYYNIANVTVKLVYLDDIHGSCGYSGNNYVIALTPNKEDELLLRTIFHEMTHVYQYMYKGLSMWDDVLNLIEWSGDTYQYDMNNEFDYENAEWEIEANEAEFSLLSMFQLRNL